MSDGVPLATVQINDKQCTYCLDCVDTCPSGALVYDHCFEHNPLECMNCESCELICEYEAITINNGVILDE